MERYERPGEKLQSKVPNDAYREGWDRIFGKKTKLVHPCQGHCIENEKEEIDIQKHPRNSGTD